MAPTRHKTPCYTYSGTDPHNNYKVGGIIRIFKLRNKKSREIDKPRFLSRSTWFPSHCSFHYMTLLSLQLPQTEAGFVASSLRRPTKYIFSANMQILFHQSLSYFLQSVSVLSDVFYLLLWGLILLHFSHPAPGTAAHPRSGILCSGGILSEQLDSGLNHETPLRATSDLSKDTRRSRGRTRTRSPSSQTLIRSLPHQQPPRPKTWTPVHLSWSPNPAWNRTGSRKTPAKCGQHLFPHSPLIIHLVPKSCPYNL